MRKEQKVIVISLVLVVLVGSVFSWYAMLQPSKVGGEAFPMVVEDDFGRSVTVTECPDRIVSLSPSNTEILFALGLGGRVVGVTEYCDYPPEVKSLVRSGNVSVIGGFSNPSVEKVVALEPDLILATFTVQTEVVRSLDEKGLTVVALKPADVSGVLKNILLIGKITGRADAAEKIVREMEERIGEVTDKTRNLTDRPRVYYEVWHDPLMTIGPRTYPHELIEMAGGVNIFADAKTEYPIISPESVIERNPEVIIIKTGYMGGVAKQDIKTRPGWENIDAVKNDRIYEIEENLVIRPGPRIVEGLEAVAKVINPQAFEKI